MSDSTDSKLTELIESHRMAVQKNDFAAAEQDGTAVLNLAWERMLEAAERGEIPEDFLCTVTAHECEERGDWDGTVVRI